MLRKTIYGGPLPLRRMLRRIYKASVDIVLCAPNKKGIKTEKLIAPTNQRLRGARTQKKRLIPGAMSAQIHQRQPKTNGNECLLLTASRRRGLSRNSPACFVG
jgi:hypothetical protein